MNKYFIQALYQLYPQIYKTVGGEAFDEAGNIVDYNAVLVQAEANKIDCKNQAAQKLQLTDWTSIADVGNSQMSNPYLVNQAEFIAYRSQIRALAVNPVENPVWPTQPTEQWSS